MPEALIHPTAQELTAFGLGKLPENRAAAVAAHLESCPACRMAVANVPPDSFLGKVRAAKPNTSSLPARSSDGPIVEKPSASPKDLPPELASYSKYRFQRELGRGGMGVVYQAEQTVMGRTVAVKVINPSVLDHPDALPRFQGEVRAAARLDHPNIVRAFDADQVGSLHLLVMEYVEGTSLADLVAKKGPLSVAYACHYVRQAALGLQHAFEQGMVHRDIKPQNLMVNARGQVKVLDFGLARMRIEKAGGRLTQLDAFMGTPEYVSPEQATDARSADTRADIYSLGCTLFFLLTGRPPFQGDTIVKLIMAQIEKEAPALHELFPEVPLELSAVVARMLAKDPVRRFQTPVEVAQALAAFVKAGTKTPKGVASPAAGVSSPGTGTAMAVDTSKIKAILRDVPEKAPAQKVPHEAEAASVFAGLGESVASAKRKGKPARKAAKPVASDAQPSWQKKWLLGGGIGVGVLLLVVFGVWAIVVTVKTPDGTIVVENVPADAEMHVVGQTVTLTRKGDEITVTTVHEGPHKLKVVQAGRAIWSSDVTVKLGGKPVRVKCEPEVVQSRPPLPPPDPPKKGGAGPLPSEEEWISKVKNLPAVQQFEKMKAKLKECNPGFDGDAKPTYENECVTGLRFMTENVTDISPLRELPQLKSLILAATHARKGSLADLSPLKGMSLTKLVCEINQVTDLSPLAGMPLEHLSCGMNRLNGDLSPLKGMPLKELHLWGWNGSNLSPLKGMPLAVLNCGGAPVEDLSPLERMPLTWLCLNYTHVSDLSPLKGMPLKVLLAGNTRVTDLTPLKGMPLSFLFIRGSRVTDLTPIRELPLTELTCDFQPERDAEILRSIKPLEKINGKPAAQFWNEVDATNTSNATDSSSGKKPGVNSSKKQLADLLVVGSVWKGPVSPAGNLVLYVQQRTDSTFHAVHAWHSLKDGQFESLVRHVQGEVKRNSLDYRSAGSDLFHVTGTWKSDCLEITHRNFDGGEATAKLKPDETESMSANSVVSIFRRNDAEGWYTLNDDDTEGATRPIVVDSLGPPENQHDDYHWLLAIHIPNRKVWGWHAPKKFHGNHSGKFGRCLMYSIWSEKTGNTPPTDKYVVLRGSGITLFLDGTRLKPPVSGEWKHYTVQLDSSSGWKLPGGRLATDEDIKKALSDVMDLRIKGEYGFKSNGCLATVLFGADDSLKLEKAGPKSTSPLKAPSDPSVVGTWYGILPDGTWIFEFRQDHTVKGTNHFSGTWRQRGRTVTVTGTDKPPPGIGKKWEGVIDQTGEDMTLTNDQSGMVGIYAKHNSAHSVPSVVGKWDGTFPDGKPATFEFLRDNTVTGTNGWRGTWRQKGRTVTAIDKNDLPADNPIGRKWSGVIEQTGGKMTLTNYPSGIECKYVKKK